MSGALIRGQEILRLFSGDIPSPLIITSRLQVHGASVGWASGEYALVPLVYDDVPADSVETGRTVELVDGTVQVTRTWEPAVPSIPIACTRTQGLLALLNDGMADPVGDITTVIAAIPDPAQRTAAEIKFEADTWYRDDPLVARLGSALGLDSDAIDILFRAAQAY